MRYITEQELRDAFSKGVPAHYEVPREARLTPAARQYLIDNRLYRQPASGESGPIRTASTIKPEHMTNLDATRLVAKTHPRIALRGKLDSLEADILLVQTTAAERGDSMTASRQPSTCGTSTCTRAPRCMRDRGSPADREALPACSDAPPPGTQDRRRRRR